ncbi:cupin domain-containing protein [Tepidamorphus sp. 3E244]|uniref:cupin domain-containing protein n=1 Tax=Tepidamorphus sp. 3E244 TaxID=3385498 RepID=UPI0038FD0109
MTQQPEFPEEFEAAGSNPCVGSVLVSQSERNRVWYMHLKPGQRIGYHCHVLDYFWTCLTNGRAQSRIDGAAPVARDYAPGDTAHMSYAKGERMIHDLENVGDTDLVFITVENLDSANDPLPLPDGVTPTGAIPDRISVQ